MKIPHHKVGDKIKFAGIKSPLSVMARANGFTICAKRMTGACADLLQFYVIVDWKAEVRGPDNYYNRFEYIDPDQARKAVKMLGRGMKRIRFKGRYCRTDPELEISHRRRIPLDFVSVIPAKAA